MKPCSTLLSPFLGKCIYTTLILSLLGIQSYGQLNISMTVTQVSTTIGDCDGFLAGDSDPAWWWTGPGIVDDQCTSTTCNGCTIGTSQSLVNESFNCASEVPSTVQVRFRGCENDAGGCVLGLFAGICDGNSADRTDNIALPTTPGTYNIGPYCANSSGCSGTWCYWAQIVVSGSFIGGPNDLICNAIDLGTLGSGATIGNNGLSNYNNFCAGSSGDPNPPGWTNEQGVWFSFTTSNNPSTIITIDATNDPQGFGDQIDLQLALYESSNNACTGSLANVGSDYDPILFGETMDVNCLLPNTTYYLLVDGWEDPLNILGTSEGYFGLEIVDQGISQAGDQICDAQNLGVVPDNGSIATPNLSQSNVCATDTNDPTPGAWGSDNGVWYQFTAPASGHVIIDADSDLIFPLGTDAIDLQLAVYGTTDNTCNGSLQEEGSDYDPIIFNETLEVRCLVAGDPYWLFVDGSGLNSTGIFDITITDGGDFPAPNDDICDAEALGTPAVGSPVGMNTENNYCADNIMEPIPSNWQNESGVWYSFIAPTSGVVDIQLESLGSDAIDLQVAVYDSDDQSCTGSLTEIESEYEGLGVPLFWDEDMRVECLEPGRLYYILVDGEAGLLNTDPLIGEFDITVVEVDQDPPGPNDLPCDAIALGNPAGGSVTTDIGSSPPSQNNFCADTSGEPNPANFSSDQTVWYTFIAPPTRNVTITLDQDGIIGNDDAIDLQVSVWESSDGTCNGTFSEIEVDAGFLGDIFFDIDVEVTCLEPGNTYWIMVDGEANILDGDLVEGYFDVTVEEDPATAVTPNDEICMATNMGNPFLGSSLSLSNENNLCAGDDGDPDPAAFDTDQTVWYTFTTPATGGPFAVEIETVSDFPFFVDAIDLQIAVFESSDNTCNGILTEVTSDYDPIDFPPLNETIEVQCLEAGNTYFVMVDGSFINVQGYFDINISEISAVPIPTNDLICDAIGLGQVPIGGSVGNGNDYYNFCSDDIGDPNPSEFGTDQTVWFTFEAPMHPGANTTSSVTLDLNSDPNGLGDLIDLQVAVFESSDGTCNGTMSELESEDDFFSFDVGMDVDCLIPGETYFVMVDGGALNVEGYFTLEVSDNGTGSIPPYNDICNAVDLGPVPDGGVIPAGPNYNNICTNTEPGEPGPSAFGIDQTVWFTFEAPTSGNATIDLNNQGGIDLQVAIYTSSDGTCNGSLNEHDSEYDGLGLFFDEDITLTCLVAGETYFVQIDGSDNGDLIGGAEGTFTIEIDDDGGSTVFPPNNDICNAEDFGLALGSISVLSNENNICADTEPGEPGENGYAQQTVWYSFIAPNSGRVDITLSANDLLGIDSEIYLFSSSNNTCTGSLTEIDMDYDATQLLDEEIETSCLIPGDTYFIQVDGTTVLGPDGEFTITLVDPEADYGTGVPGDVEPPNNDCPDAVTLSVQSESCLVSSGVWNVENYGQPTIYENGPFVMGCGGSNCGDTWYQFTVPPSGLALVEGNDDAVGGILGDYSTLTVIAYTGTCGNLTPQECETGGFGDDVSFEIAGTPGETIWLQVFNDGGLDHDEDFEICVSERCGADNCDNAIVMQPNVAYCWDIEGATGEDIGAGEPGYEECGNTIFPDPDASVYFSFTSDCNGSEITLSIMNAQIGGTCLLGINPTDGFNISLYEDSTPCDGNPESLVDCQNFNICQGTIVNWSQTYTNLLPNTEYVLQIDNWDNLFGSGTNSNGEVMISTIGNPEVEATPDLSASCGNTLDGSATAMTMFGMPPYSYEWDNGETNATATMLSPGVHEVTVTDNVGCTDVDTVFIDGPLAIMPSAMLNNDADCNSASTGSATASATGGTPAYTYLWDNGETTATATMLNAGTHTVTISDAQGCSETASVTINEPPPIMATLSIDMDVQCNGENTGVATAVGAGDPSDYTYSWDTGETTATATMLNAGTHVVTITDMFGCSNTFDIVVNEPPVLSLSPSLDGDVACNGENNGSATASPAGGTPPYTYIWDNGETNSSAIMLNAGIHLVTLTDSNGCTETASINISEPSALIASASINQQVSCNTFSDGSASVSPMGGTSPYTYLWDNGETDITATNLDASTHFVTITDTNNCETTASVDITEPGILSLSTNVGGNVSCNSLNDGMATVTVSGGSMPYTYTWDNGETTASAINLNAGLHIITVSDNNGCSETASATITEPPLLTASATGEILLCNGDSDGDIDLSVGGGTAPYTFTWDNGSTDEDLSNLTAGTYCVTVTDNNGCAATACADITEPPILIASATGEALLCNSDSDGDIDLTVGGGTAPYTFTWDNGSTDEDPSGLTAGTYCVTVTDNNGCTATTCVDIT
ncbi:MAG: hypothetical protein AAF502_23130, partial [Bacteroidota bacterium]